MFDIKQRKRFNKKRDPERADCLKDSRPSVLSDLFTAYKGRRDRGRSEGGTLFFMRLKNKKKAFTLLNRGERLKGDVREQLKMKIEQIDNRNLNRGRAKSAENIRLCKELLKKGKTQREIAKILNVSLPTANKYCQKIAKEIEDRLRAAAEREEKQRIKEEERKRRAEAVLKKCREKKEELPETPEELAKAGFAACLIELRARLPSMSDEQVCKITVDLWDRVNK